MPITYSYATLNLGVLTLGYDINDLDQIGGSYFDTKWHAFTYDRTSAAPLATINAPGGINGTDGRGINDAGVLVGSYADGILNHSFRYDGVNYTVLTGETATDVNDAGQVVGNYHGIHGFFLSSSGVETSISYPGTTVTSADGVNNNGEVVGYYQDASGYHGYIYLSGSYTPYPGLDVAPGQTYLTGINDQGWLVGYYYVDGIARSFVDTNGVASGGITTLDQLGAGGTLAQGINNDGDVVGYYYDASGTHTFVASTSPTQPADGEFRVNTFVAGDQLWPAVAAFPDNGFVVVWTSNGQDGSGQGVFAQRYGNNGAPAGSEFRVNTYVNNDQSLANVAAFADGGFVIVWDSIGQDGGGTNAFGSLSRGIYARRYDANGNPVGSEFLVNSHIPDIQHAPAVATLSGGGYVVAWSSFMQDGSNYGVFGQVFDADGNKLGAEFQSNTFVIDDQGAAAVAALSDGGFVIVWQSRGQDGNGTGIYGQRYDAAGNRQGDEFQVNTFTTGDQGVPEVTPLADGGFLVTWQSTGQDGSDAGIYAQRFDHQGQTVGSEFRVNSTTIGDQAHSAVDELSDGGFVVTWSSNGQDGDGFGVFSRRFDANGNPVGGDVQINTFTTGDQHGGGQRNVAVLPNGEVVVAWQSSGQDGDGLGVFARRVSLPNANADDYRDSASDTMAPLGQIVVSSSVSGVIVPEVGDVNGDKDVFQVSLTAGQTYNITVNGAAVGGLGALSQAIFTVRDGANFNTVLGTSSEGPTANLEFTAQTTGEYYIRVGAGGADFASETGGYTVHVEAAPSPPPSLSDFAALALAAYHLVCDPVERTGNGINNLDDAADRAFSRLAQVFPDLALLTSDDLPSLARVDGGDPKFPTSGLVLGTYLNGNAAALVARAGDAVYIAFRGTNDDPNVGPNDIARVAVGDGTPDEDHWYDTNLHPLANAALIESVNLLLGPIAAAALTLKLALPDEGMAEHYELLRDFIAALDIYVEENNIQHIYVTGHSLGGAMVQKFMADHPDDPKYQAVTFGEPGYEGSASNTHDPRITNLFVSNDSVATLPALIPGSSFGEAGDDYEIVVNGKVVNSHSMSLYYAIAEYLAAHDFENTRTFYATNGQRDTLSFPIELSTLGLVIGQAADGYISGATVFADANEDGVLDVGEIAATTDAAGSFILIGGSGPLVMVGGTDIATGLPFQGHLNAPAGSSVITPLTTLIALLAAQGFADANAKVRAAFGFDHATDLTTLDPISGTSGGDARAALAYIAGIEVYNTLTLLASALAGNDPANYTNAYDSVLNALADLVVAHGPGLNLTDQVQIGELIDDAATAAGIALDPSVRDGIITIVTALNQAVEDAGGATGVDLLVALSAIALVAKGAAADALKDVGDGLADIAEVIDSFTGFNLVSALDEAKYQTGDVDGPAVQNAPQVHDDSYTTAEDVNLIIPANGVLGNDTDADGDALAAVVVDGPAHGDLTLNPDGSFSYTPYPDYNGPDGFTYKVNDGGLNSNVASVSLTVEAVNDAPTVVRPIADQSATEDAPFSFTLPADTFADIDAGDSLTLTATLADGSALPGWLTFNPVTREFSGAPLNADVGALSVRITATDGSLASVHGDFTLTIANTNDAPAANPDAGSVDENEVKTFDVLGNDTDVDIGDSKTIMSIDKVTVASSNPSIDGINAAGALSIVAGQVQFSPGILFDPLYSGESATVVVSYTMRDTAGLTSSSTLTLAIAGAAEQATLNIVNGTPGNDRHLEGTPAADKINGFGGNDEIEAGRGDDVITAGAGNDRVFAGAGNDTFLATPGDGYDFYDGESGSDLIDFSLIGSSVKINLGTTILGFTINGIGSATGAQVGTDILRSVENAIGGAGNDVVTGDNLRNILRGGAGNDTLSGLDGDDHLGGDAGNDTVLGGRGSDRMTGGAGADAFVISAAQSQSGDVDTVTDYVVGQDNLLLQGLSVIQLTQIDVNGDGVLDTLLRLSNSASIQLLNVSGVDDWRDLQLPVIRSPGERSLSILPNEGLPAINVGTDEPSVPDTAFNRDNQTVFTRSAIDSPADWYWQGELGDTNDENFDYSQLRWTDDLMVWNGQSDQSALHVNEGSASFDLGTEAPGNTIEGAAVAWFEPSFWSSGFRNSEGLTAIANNSGSDSHLGPQTSDADLCGGFPINFPAEEDGPSNSAGDDLNGALGTVVEGLPDRDLLPPGGTPDTDRIALTDGLEGTSGEVHNGSIVRRENPTTTLNFGVDDFYWL